MPESEVTVSSFEILDIRDVNEDFQLKFDTKDTFIDDNFELDNNSLRYIPNYYKCYCGGDAQICQPEAEGDL